MNNLIVAGFAAALSLATLPVSALTMAPRVSIGAGLVQTVEEGCARAYYLSHGRCVPNSSGYRSPRYRDGYYAPPRYYTAPRYYVRPRYYGERRYYEAPRYYGGQDYDGGVEY